MKKHGSFVKSNNVGLSLPVEEEKKEGEKREVEKEVTKDEFGGKAELPYDRIGRWGWGA